MPNNSARIAFALTGLTATIALVLRVVLTATDAEGVYASHWANVGNLFCYFTILSNLCVAVTNLMLAFRPQRDSTRFRVFRLDGVVAIIVTAIVYHALLAADNDYHGLHLLADALLHTVSPVLTVVAWLVFGPRKMVTTRVSGLALVAPILWLVLTLTRGAIDGFYPYEFLDHRIDGWVAVAPIVVVVTLAFIVMAYAARPLDQWLASKRR